MKLTDDSWEKVFLIRCRSKRGESITKSELALCSRARHEDPTRYKAMSSDVFDATVPFGSTAKMKRSE